MNLHRGNFNLMYRDGFDLQSSSGVDIRSLLVSGDEIRA